MNTHLVFRMFQYPYLLMAGFALVLMLVYLTLLQWRRISQYFAFWVIARIGIIVCVLFFLLNPWIEKYRLEPRNPRIAVFLDASASMNVPDVHGLNRWENAVRWIRKVDKRWLAGVFLFGEKVREVSEKWYERKPQDVSTDFLDLLKNISRLQKQYDAFIVITDGINTKANSDVVLRYAEDFPFIRPVVFIHPDRKEINDVSITEIHSPAFVYADEPAKVEVTLNSSGKARRWKGNVNLRENDRLLSTQTVRMSKGKGNVSFTFVPSGEGVHIYEVSISADDDAKQNNTAFFVVEAVKRTVRVLHIAGRASWDVRFLRKVLKEDPRTNLITFIILRTPEDYFVARDRELSLIPFPGKELFVDAIDEFDIIVLQNFPARPYVVPRYFKSIAGSIKRGHNSLFFIGGEESIARGGYTFSSIYPLMPVKFVRAPYYSHKRTTLQLTDVGTHHYLTSIFGSLDGALFIEGYIKGVAPRDGCAVLAESADERVPLVVACEKTSTGARLYVGTDTIWTLHAQSVEKNLYYDLYNEFMRRAIRWLTGHAGLEGRSVMRINEMEYEAGDAVKIQVRVPAGQASGKMRIVSKTDGKKVAYEFKNISNEWKTIRVLHLKQGIYQAELLSESNEVLADKEFVYAPVFEEMVRLTVDTQFLEDLAGMLGKEKSRVFKIGDVSPRELDSLLGENVFYRREQVAAWPMWHSPLIFAFFCVALVIDWIARRKNGLS